MEQKKWFDRLINEESDVALVRIFECFLEVAPQKILQISIILSGEENITGKTQMGTEPIQHFFESNLISMVIVQVLKS